MSTSRTSLFATTLLLLAATACGGSGNGPNPSMPEEPYPPSTDVLCRIIPTRSKIADVIALLGNPQNRTDVGSMAHLYYQYRSASGGVIPHCGVAFDFDHEVLFNIAMVNLSRPVCWQINNPHSG